MQRRAGFTLIEIAIAVFILMLLLLLAIPSVKNSVILRPEAIAEGDPDVATATLVLDKGQAYLLRLPATLEKNPPAQWIFWPSGACEPANVRFKGPDGSWEVNYAPLTARPEIVRYAAK